MRWAATFKAVLFGHLEHERTLLGPSWFVLEKEMKSLYPMVEKKTAKELDKGRKDGEAMLDTGL